MIRFPLFVVLIVIFLLPANGFGQEAPARLWKTAGGKFTVEAVLLEVKDGKARLKRVDNGNIAAVPLDKLSEADRTYLKELAAAKNKADDPASDSEPPKVEEPTKQPPRFEKPSQPVMPLPSEGSQPAVEENNGKAEEPKAKDRVPSASIPPGDTDEASNALPPRKDNDSKAPLSKPSIPFRSTKTPGGTNDLKLPGNEGVVSSGIDELPERITRSGGVLPAPIQPIDAANVTVERLPGDARLRDISDQQLIDSLHLRSELRWKGDVNLSHLLEPKAPNFELLIFAENSTALSAAKNIGHVDVREITNGTGTNFKPARFPPGVSNPRTGWVKIASQRANRFVSTEDLQNSVVVGVEFVRPQLMPRKMEKISGEFQVRFALDQQKLTLNNADLQHGELQHSMLAEKGIQVTIRRPDLATLVVELSGNVDDVAAVKSVANGEATSGAIHAVSPKTGFVQFNYRDSVPLSTQLVFEVLTETRALKIPFDFKDVQLILPETKADSTAG